MPKSTVQSQAPDLQLPFILHPKPEKVLIGNDEIGQLEIPKYGKLLDCELDTIESLQNEIVDLRQSALQMAREISRASGKKLIDVYYAISSNDNNLLEENIEQVLDLRHLQQKLEKKTPAILATTIITHRLVPGWQLEDTSNPQKIHPKLLEFLAEFAMQEKGINTELLGEGELESVNDSSSEAADESEPEPANESSETPTPSVSPETELVTQPSSALDSEEK